MVPIERLLHEAIGLDATSIGHSTVERAVLERQRACGLPASTYVSLVEESAAELQELIDEVVIPETWFFRDPQAFAMLTRVVRDEWLPAHPTGTLRLLSLASSTGEEPYSMAMALLDAGVPGERFSIDGLDVSTRALSRAIRGVYGRTSFRGNGVNVRDRYFVAEPDGYRVIEEVRRQVQFRRGNICVAGSIPGVAVYDVIFCRNLLIYFDRAMHDRALDVLERLLTPTGMLFVAPCETGLLLNRASGWSMEPKAFGFRRGLPPQARPLAPAPGREPATVVVDPRAFAPAKPKALVRSDTERPAPKSRDAEKSLDAATVLADQGRFEEAAAKCEEHVRQHGPSAAVFHLLGVLRDAAGQTADAVSYYRKSLSLDPNNQEVLFHLALLLDKLDQKADAIAVRSRARQLAQRPAAR